MRKLRLIPDNTSIRFMRGRFAGLIVSAILSLGSLGLFFSPGLNYGVDFQGGVLVEVRFAAPVEADAVRSAFADLHLGEVKLQQFGSARDALVTLGAQAGNDAARAAVQAMVVKRFPGAEIRRLEVVGAKVSNELFRRGLLAIGCALAAILIYVWFRFDWPFGVGVVATLVLDATKTIGFFALMRLHFDLNSVAAILVLIGYSVTDKVVVYDRIRENLRKFKTMPLRELIDLSINQTLSRTVVTSLMVLLSILPLAFMGGESVQVFAITIIFGIIVGTSSSIFIASPILLFIGQKHLRPAIQAVAAKPAKATV